MLDHGASLKAQCRGDKVNVLHAFFFERVHDFSLEAPLLQRLLDAGANINQYSPRFSLPLKVMLGNSAFRDDNAGLVYDVIFSRPDVDWEAFADVTSGERRSLRFFVEHMKKPLPVFYRRMCEYIENGPSPRPTFEEGR